MRAVLFILILVVAVLLIAVATGFVDIRQTREARVPDVSASDNGIGARGGQTPAFDIETGSVEIGTTDANVTLPTVDVTPANQMNANAASEANTAG